MRPKILQCVVTFHSTTDAMRFEQSAKEAGFGGRIIPVPRELTAGCGLAWKDEVSEKEALEQMLKQQQLGYERIVELII